MHFILQYILIMVFVWNLTKKANKNILGDLVYLEILVTVFTYVRENVFDQAMSNVGPTTY